MITFFFRKKREGVNSIEMVFSTIESLLPLHTSIQLPCEGASPKEYSFCLSEQSED